MRLKYQPLATCDPAISSALAREQQTEKGELWALLPEEHVVELLETFPDVSDPLILRRSWNPL